ncbi:MAG: protein kinase [Caldilineaceae bacterium]|nr:protein kinase [Caldilineaceae bacterium]
MFECLACGQANRAGAHFCARCRAPLNVQLCPGCNGLNRRGAKFCVACGRALVQKCLHCQQENRRQARHCTRCGAPLAEIRCPHCQTTNRTSAKHCRGCAANLTHPNAPQQLAGTGSLPSGLVLNGRYTIVAKLAQGGMSAVYKVLDNRQPGKGWALKEMSVENLDPAEVATAIQDFHREADLLRKLDHANLVKVIDRFTTGAKEYLVMEWIEGETLEEMAGTGVLPEAEVLKIAFQLCAVLEYLHQQVPPIIYRDLKPGNIMVERSTGLLKLIDFGIVRFHKPGQRKDTKLLGTPGFAPPEQYGKGQTDARSDIFALGVTLLILLTAYDVTQNPWAYPPARQLNAQVSARLEEVILKAVKLKVQERYQTIAEMRSTLKLCKNAKKILATMPSLNTKAHTYQFSLPVLALPVVDIPFSSSPLPSGNQQTPIVPQPALAALPVSVPAIPQLHIMPFSLTLQGTTARTVEEQLTVTNVQGQVVQGQVSTSAHWLVVQPETFIDAQATLTVTAQTAQVTLPQVKQPAPALLTQAWQWAAQQGAVAQPWKAPHTWQQTLLFGIPALLGGGLAQGLLWLIYWHASHWLIGPVQLDETIEIRAGNDTATVPVKVEVVPAWPRLLAIWGAAIVAVGSEIAIFLLFVSQLL